MHRGRNSFCGFQRGSQQVRRDQIWTKAECGRSSYRLDTAQGSDSWEQHRRRKTAHEKQGEKTSGEWLLNCSVLLPAISYSLLASSVRFLLVTGRRLLISRGVHAVPQERSINYQEPHKSTWSKTDIMLSCQALARLPCEQAIGTVFTGNPIPVYAVTVWNLSEKTSRMHVSRKVSLLLT